MVVPGIVIAPAKDWFVWLKGSESCMHAAIPCNVLDAASELAMALQIAASNDGVKHLLPVLSSTPRSLRTLNALSS